MQKITVNENALRASIRKQLHEDAATARSIQGIINKLYRCANRFGGIYHDMGWGNVTKVMEALASVEGVTGMNSGAGEYHDYLTSANDQRPASRTYALTFETVYRSSSATQQALRRTRLSSMTLPVNSGATTITIDNSPGLPVK